jgi:hypothetical protein
MGFFSALKRLFFASESVAKSAIDQAETVLHEKGQEVSQTITQSTQKIWSAAEGLQEKIEEKAAEISEATGKKVVEVSDRAWDTISEKGESLVEKAKEISQELTEKFEEAVARAESFVEEDSKVNKDLQENHVKSSLLENTETFFAKAEAFLEGAVDKKNATSEAAVWSAAEPSERTPAKIAGQEDHDGDGNEQIDDAMLDDHSSNTDITP